MKYKYQIEQVWGDEVEIPDNAKIVGVLEDKGSGDADGATYIAFLTPVPDKKDNDVDRVGMIHVNYDKHETTVYDKDGEVKANG